jgi:hypothetical protein
VLSRSALKVETPVGDDVHATVFHVPKKLGRDGVNTQCLERVVDYAKLLLAVQVVGTNDPASLYFPSSVTNKGARFDLFSTK